MNDVSVYWVSPDYTGGYRTLLFDLPESELTEEYLYFHRSPKSGSWPSPPPPVYIDDEVYVDTNPLAPDPDIWNLSVGTTLATTPEIIERLEPFLSMSAELLPLENRTGDELELFALNIVNQLDTEQCMDLSVCEEERRRLVEEAAARLTTSEAEELRRGLAEGDPWPVLYPEFKPDCLGDPTLFTVSRLGMMLCVERDDHDDSLMRRISELSITGLGFTKLWSSVTGAEPINLFRP
jgi:hypothetical protein